MNEMVTIPREEYDRLRAAAEDLADLQSYDRAKAALAAGAEELIPGDYANRLLDGESPLRVDRNLARHGGRPRRHAGRSDGVVAAESGRSHLEYLCVQKHLRPAMVDPTRCWSDPLKV